MDIQELKRRAGIPEAISAEDELKPVSLDTDRLRRSIVKAKQLVDAGQKEQASQVLMLVLRSLRTQDASGSEAPPLNEE